MTLESDGPLRRRRLPSMAVMPTLLTLGNLVAGFSAIAYAAKTDDFVGPWGWSGLTMAGSLIFLGMFLDAMDGTVARMTRSVSPLGGQLDSLADAVTFGVAPAFMMLMLVSRQVGGETIIIGPEADNALGKVIWSIAVLYVCCAGLRLARFNVESLTDRPKRHGRFRGLPSPGAAGAVASLTLLHQHWLVNKYLGDVPDAFVRSSALGIPLVMLICALAMVSTIPYVHVTRRYAEGARSFGYVVRIVVPLFVAIWFPQETLAAVFTAYLFSGPWRRLRRRLHVRERSRQRAPVVPGETSLAGGRGTDTLSS